MALQSGVGLSRILILAGAGYTSTILMKNGKLSEILAEIQALMSGSGDQNTDADLTAQLRRLAGEVQRLGSAQRITVLNGNNSSGNLTALVVPAATVGALGYGYMWWKGISFSDLMYVTKRNMATAVTNLTKHLDHVSDALAATKKHLTQRIQGLNDKMDKQEEVSKLIQQDVAIACGALQDVGLDLQQLQAMVSNLDGKIGSLEYKQEYAVAGVSYLVQFVNGGKLDMPKHLQEQISNPTRPSLRNGDEEQLPIKIRQLLPCVDEGMKFLTDIGGALDRSTSVPAVQDANRNVEAKGRILSRAASAKC